MPEDSEIKKALARPQYFTSHALPLLGETFAGPFHQKMNCGYSYATD